MFFNYKNPKIVFTKFRLNIIINSFLFFLIIVSCAKKSPTHTHNYNNTNSNILSSDDVAANDKTLSGLLQVDPSQLKIQSLSTILKPRTDKFFDLVIAVQGDNKTQYYKISICDAQNQNDSSKCQSFVGYQASYKLPSFIIVEASNLVIEVKPCVLAKYSTTDELCAAGRKISQKAPSVVDPVLKGLYAQRRSVLAQLKSWDQVIFDNIKEFQKTIDKCQAGNEKFIKKEEKKSLINMIAMLAGSLVPPSQTFSDESDFGVFVDLKKEVEGKTINEINILIDSAAQAGYDGYEYVAALRYYQAAKKILQIKDRFWQTFKQINSFVEKLQYGGLFSVGNMHGLSNKIFGPPTGSTINFMATVGNAIYELNATHVFLPCDEHQFISDEFNMAFTEQLVSFKAKLCKINKEINTKRTEVGLKQKEYPGCG